MRGDVGDDWQRYQRVSSARGCKSGDHAMVQKKEEGVIVVWIERLLQDRTVGRCINAD